MNTLSSQSKGCPVKTDKIKPDGFQQISLNKHMTVLKTFFAIIICFIVTYGSAFVFLLSLTDNYFVSYVYFINHINNPFIYFAFSKGYRKDMIDLLGRFQN